jgi:hypothetical protein
MADERKPVGKHPAFLRETVPALGNCNARRITPGCHSTQGCERGPISTVLGCAMLQVVNVNG